MNLKRWLLSVCPHKRLTFVFGATLTESLPEKNDSISKFHLFMRPKDEKAELWEGARSGIQAALDVFNADEVTFYPA